MTRKNTFQPALENERPSVLLLLFFSPFQVTIRSVHLVVIHAVQGCIRRRIKGCQVLGQQLFSASMRSAEMGIHPPHFGARCWLRAVRCLHAVSARRVLSFFLPALRAQYTAQRIRKKRQAVVASEHRSLSLTRLSLLRWHAGTEQRLLLSAGERMWRQRGLGTFVIVAIGKNTSDRTMFAVAAIRQWRESVSSKQARREVQLR